MDKNKKIVLLVVLAIFVPFVGIPILIVVLLKDNKTNTQSDASCQATIEQQVEIKRQPIPTNNKQISNLEKTPRENALRENKKLTLILGIITIVSFVIALIFSILDSKKQSDFFATIYVIFLFVTFFGLCLTGVVFSDKKRIKRSYCPYCGEKYDYLQDVAWEVSNITISNNSKNADVEFQCSCSNCGEETKFTKNFKIAYFQNGKYIEKNIQTEAKRYFK